MTPSPLIALLIGLAVVFWSYRRRRRRAMRALDHWFKPEGDGYIYQPRGRWGRAYRVSAATRETIQRKTAELIGVPLACLVAIYLFPLIVMNVDLGLYRGLAPWLLAMRLGLAALVLAGCLVWHHLAIRPLYVDAPRSAQRISTHEVRLKRANATSWASILCYAALLAGLTVAAFLGGMRAHDPRLEIGGGVLALFTLNLLRLGWVKYRAAKG